MIFETFVAVSMKIGIFWYVPYCSLVEICQSFCNGNLSHEFLRQKNFALKRQELGSSEMSVNLYQNIRNNVPPHPTAHSKLLRSTGGGKPVYYANDKCEEQNKAYRFLLLRINLPLFFSVLSCDCVPLLQK